ncbi:hypothetical protein [Acinetobacter chinensis]|uniref:hypothetical protein n=1 Tax=Acinetobacter chinensis TaxID=2004650 RepID=UPI0029343DAF|nr:hypothetical protein [Acinetobacter chinensis]WOE42588.1 hypothetical protein QSG87_05530 [Acinetobacter chinensis]
MKYLVLPFSLFSQCVWSADEYRIDYQIERLDANGVTTIQKYSEKMIRDAQNIWIERLNTQTYADRAHTHGNAQESARTAPHEHVSFDSAIQWMQRKDVGEQANTASLFQRFYILPDEKMRVQLQDVDQEMLGLKSCWRCEYSLIHPDILKRAQLIQRDPESAHYQIRSAGQTLNIIWNELDQLVQKYELLKPASGYTKTFTVRKIDQQVAAPWTQTEKYSERDYADFSD